MDPFEVNEDVTSYSDEEIAALIEDGNGRLDALLALEAPSEEDVAEAERIHGLIDTLEAAVASRNAASSERVARMSALRDSRVTASDESEDGDEEEPEEEPEEEDGDEGEELSAETAAPAPPAPARQTLARRTARPKAPARKRSGLTVLAAADVPGFSTGSEINDLEALGVATVARMKGFPKPVGIEGGQMTNYAVAQFRREFPEDLVIDRGSDDQTVIDNAAKESNLPGGSLVAAGGWCAPSETLYDFCVTETTDGLLSLPEVEVRRGGIRFTKGIDFSTIYSNVGFSQTEAQAIAGTTKPCYEVPCPTFTDVRLDAKGICIKVPILTNSAYPEIVQRIIAGSLVAHQHKVSESLITQMVTASGNVIESANMGAASTSILDATERVVLAFRQRYRLSLSATLEVVLPFWLRASFRADLAARTGMAELAVTDAQIDGWFRSRGANPQWVYNWQALPDLPASPTGTFRMGLPTTVDMLVYPAGTFVKGTSDVISLSAVYDAASLSVNTYTGLFFEEGVLLAQRCFNSHVIRVPLCHGGITGAANSTACFAPVA